ncbi:hypothetical protein RBSWK_04405 [Rhodopirellula baltica SWK14]|nr:hypothetical protein RBSWK_04405 [Rhodopirellula baltica SWK14]
MVVEMESNQKRITRRLLICPTSDPVDSILQGRKRALQVMSHFSEQDKESFRTT